MEEVKEENTTEESNKEVVEEKGGKKKTSFWLPLAALVFAGLIIGAGFLFRNIFFRVEELASLESESEEVEELVEEIEEMVGEGGNGEVSLPENFPSDLPSYPDAVIVSSWRGGEGDAQGMSVLWETEASVEEVSEYYRENLENSGWEASAAIETEDSATFGLTKNGSEGFVGITRGEQGKTIISIAIGIEERL